MEVYCSSCVAKRCYVIPFLLFKNVIPESNYLIEKSDLMTP